MKDREKERVLELGVVALEGHMRALKDDLERREYGQAAHNLRSMRFLASRIEELLTDKTVSEGDRIAFGPVVRKHRIEGRSFQASILEILQDSGDPMSVSQLMRELKRRNIEIPGQGRPANVIVHLNRMPEVERISHGTYRLVYSARKEVPQRNDQQPNKSKATGNRAPATRRTT